MGRILDLEFDKPVVNLILLHEEIMGLNLGTLPDGQARFAGLSFGGGLKVRVHVTDDVLPDEVALIRTVIEVHDANKLTAKQKSEGDRRAEIIALRSKDASEWTPEERDRLLVLLLGNMVTEG